LDAVTGIVTPMQVGTAQITATKTADETYRSATASYMLSMLESVSVPFTAAIGAQDAQVSFAPGAPGLEFLSSTQTDCDVAQFVACTDNRIDTKEVTREGSTLLATPCIAQIELVRSILYGERRRRSTV
jgi:hypothetical protein